MELVIGAAILWAAWHGVREAARDVASSYRDRKIRWGAAAARMRGAPARDGMAPAVSSKAIRVGIVAGALAGTTAVAAVLAGRGFGRGARAGWTLGRTWGKARLQRRRYGVEPGDADEATEIVDAELVDEEPKEGTEQPEESFRPDPDPNLWPVDAEEAAWLRKRIPEYDAKAEQFRRDGNPKMAGVYVSLAARRRRRLAHYRDPEALPATPPQDVPADRPGESPNGERAMAQMQSEVVTYDTHVHNLTVLQGEARAEYEAAELGREAAEAVARRAEQDAQHAEAMMAGLAAADFGQKHVANMATLQELFANQVQVSRNLRASTAALMEQSEALIAEAERARREFEADHRQLAEAHADAPHAAKREGYVSQ